MLYHDGLTIVRPRLTCGILIYLCVSGSLNAAPSQPDLEALSKANRWFELRDAVQTGRSLDFYTGAVAAAFGRNKEALRFLKRASRSDPDVTHRAVADGYLAALCDRMGRYRDAFDWRRRMDAVSSQSQIPIARTQSQALLKAFSLLPDQRVTHRGYSLLKCSKDRSVVAIPVEIDGRAGCYSLDTSSAFSSVGESEARRIGLEMQGEGFDLNGIHVRIGVAHELKAGKFRIRNPAFVVFPGDPAAYGSEPGILGISMVLAFETIRWSSDGAVELGFPSDQSAAAPNMYFNWMLPVIGIDVVGRRVSLQLDTGSDHTFLWPEFAGAFPSVTVLAGPLDHYRQIGLFGSTSVVAFWPIPELQFAVGGAPLTLRGVKLLAAETQKNCMWCYGALGVDLVGDAGTVTIDFRAMRATLREPTRP
jgi:hypothetical protein